MSANKASKKASAAQAQQQRQYEEDKAFRMKIYNEEVARRDKAEAPLWAEVNQSPGAFYAKYAGDVNQRFDNAGRAIDEQVASQKMQGSGLESALKQGNELERAKTLSRAWQQGLADRRSLAAALAGRTDTNNAANGVSNATDRMGAFWGQQAGQWGQQAAAGWATAGQALSNGYSVMKDWYKAQNPPPSATPTAPK